MSEELKTSGPSSDEAVDEKNKRNGSGPQKKKRASDPVPGLNLAELYEDRNWTALAGLGLIAVGFLLVIQHMLNLDLTLWSLVLLGAGGWLIVDAWKRYSAEHTWTDTSRNRLYAGGAALVIGLLSAMQVHWGSLLLIGAGAWLGYDTWQRYQAAGHAWTRPMRNRMFVAAALGLIGLSTFIHLGSAWLLLIVIGVVMFYRRNRSGHWC